MKNHWKTIQLGLLLFALPLVATAAVSANQWMNREVPLTLDINASAYVDDGIGVARVHEVALNANGVIDGRVAALNTSGSQGLSDLTVFFMQNGQVAAQTQTAADGTFVVRGVQPGIYSFIATGKNGFAAYGIKVLAAGEKNIDNVIETAAVSPSSAAVKQILGNNLPSQVVQNIASNAASAEAPMGANRVLLQNGQLNGSVNSLLSGQDLAATIYILDGDQQIAKVETDADGNFSVADLKPGIYGLVATSSNGFAAVSFEAVQGVDVGEIPVSVEPSAVQPENAVVFQDVLPTNPPAMQELPTSLNTFITPYQDIVIDEEIEQPGYIMEFAPVEYVGETVSYGGAVGGTGGSVGNFAGVPTQTFGSPLRAGVGRIGGGRLGRLALLGGAVAGIVAIADDGDSGAASPAAPN